MVIVFVDCVGSTEHSERYGAAGVAAITETLAKFEAALTGESSVMRLGSPMGDGLLLVGADADAVAILERAVTAQQEIPTVLPVRITLGIGDPAWINGPAWHPASTISGYVVNLVARLQSVCPPSGIAFDGGTYARLSEHPALRRKAVAQQTALKGIAGTVTYWAIARDGVARSDTATTVEPVPVADTVSANGNEVSVRVPWFAVRVKGRHALLGAGVLVILLGTGWGAFAFVNGLITHATAEHRYIIEEIQVTNYIIAECLRTRGDCPKMPRPKRLQDARNDRPIEP